MSESNNTENENACMHDSEENERSDYDVPSDSKSGHGCTKNDAKNGSDDVQSDAKQVSDAEGIESWNEHNSKQSWSGSDSESNSDSKRSESSSVPEWGSDSESGSGQMHSDAEGSGNGSDSEKSCSDETSSCGGSQSDYNMISEACPNDEHNFAPGTDISQLNNTILFPFFHIKESSRLPLYPGAPLSMEASWLSIHQFAISNHLTDSATKQLLDLIRIHCPQSSPYPPSLYNLRKKLGLNDGVTNLHYCSNCMTKVSKECPNRICRRTKSQLCHFSILPFQSHLHNIFTSMEELVLAINYLLLPCRSLGCCSVPIF